MKCNLTNDLARWIRVLNVTLIIEAASTSETSVTFTRLQGATTKKTDIFTV
jgi:hypothetical protein